MFFFLNKSEVAQLPHLCNQTHERHLSFNWLDRLFTKQVVKLLVLEFSTRRRVAALWCEVRRSRIAYFITYFTAIIANNALFDFVWETGRSKLSDFCNVGTQDTQQQRTGRSCCQQRFHVIQTVQFTNGVVRNIRGRNFVAE